MPIELSSEGWLGRYFDNCCVGADPTVGVAIGERNAAVLHRQNSDRGRFLAAGTVSFDKQRPSSGKRMNEEEMSSPAIERAPDETSIAAPKVDSIGAIAGSNRVRLQHG